MPDPAADKRAHLLLHDTSHPHAFTAHSPGGGKQKLPERDRQEHGQSLLGALQGLKPAAEAAVASQRQLELESGLGLQIEFIGQPDVELAFQSLADDRKKIELLSACSIRASIEAIRSLSLCSPSRTSTRSTRLGESTTQRIMAPAWRAWPPTAT